MAFNTRIFGIQGIAQIQQLHVKQFNADSVFLTEEPSVFGQVVVTTAVAALSIADPDTKTTLLAIEVPDSQAIRYRVIPAGWPVIDADTNCRRLTGVNMVRFSAGWRISIIDAAGLL